mgnify:CR=1 FL=1
MIASFIHEYLQLLGCARGSESEAGIIAPGGNIYSTLDGGTYGIMSGTSMASPAMAGLSALVLQYIKDQNLEERTGLSARA